MTQTQADSTTERIEAARIALPSPVVSMSQDREWCVVEIDGKWRKIRFHDYDEIYAVPGLYEALFYDVLKCKSPEKIRGLLRRCVGESGLHPSDLRVLDLGAGNGMVGEELSDMGVRHIVGVDIIRAAAEAALRDRQPVYDDFFVLDMADLSQQQRQCLSSFGFNCLTCVAALGFGDIPSRAFANAFNLIAPSGWVAFNIKSDFLEPRDASGFAALIRRMLDDGTIILKARQEYRHRLATTGEPLLYTAFVGVKQRDIPRASWA